VVLDAPLQPGRVSSSWAPPSRCAGSDGLLPHELVGLNITIYDPDLDPDGSVGALLADLVVSAFAES
jgi:hypothetical protein